MTISFARKFETVEKRRAGRPPIGIEAAMRERGGTALQVSITDLSAFGCRITGCIRGGAGSQVWLKLPGLSSQPVNIAWADGQTIGVEFDSPLHPAVAQGFLPHSGSHAAQNCGSFDAMQDGLLSRREQILAGVAGSDLSPLQRRKKPNAMGMFGRIARTYKRQADHRHETRFGQELSHGPKEVAMAGVIGSVINVSPSGIKARLPEPIERQIGDELVVEFEGFPEVTGKLVWMNQNELGVSLPPQTIELFDSRDA